MSRQSLENQRRQFRIVVGGKPAYNGGAKFATRAVRAMATGASALKHQPSGIRILRRKREAGQEDESRNSHTDIRYPNQRTPRWLRRTIAHFSREAMLDTVLRSI